MTKSGKNLTAAGIIILLAGAPALVAAQEQKDSEQLAALKNCQAIEAAEARLACYDREVAVVVAASESGEIQVVDKEDIRETRRGLFGFSLPKTGIFGGGDDKDDEVMTSQVTSVRAIGREDYEITIAEGSVWQIKDPPRRFKPRVGDEVELEQAAMGSFWVRLNGQNGVKGRRIR